MTAAYTLFRPAEQTAPVVFSSPHSGRAYPPDFLRASVLDERTIRSSEDAWIDDLWGGAPKAGAPLIAAVMPRAFIDLNRSADELDPAVVDGVRHVAHNPRISSGLGVIPRVVAGGRAIAEGKMPRAMAEARIAHWWQPYHGCLAALMEETEARFGTAVLIDCHSMPREAVEGHPATRGQRPDVVLGDRFGTTADRGLVDRIEAILAAEGLRVARNTPFAGAYITQTYGNPTRRRHAVQIEIDRGLYMDEKTLRRHARYGEMRALLGRVTEAILDAGRDLARPSELAAE